MTSSFDPLPEWAHAVPSEPGIHPEQSALQWQRPFTVQQLLEIGEQFIEQFLAWVVRAVVGVFVPGEGSFDQLRDWATNLPDQIVSFINNVAGINLASWDDFVASLNDGKGIDLPLTFQVITNLQAFFGSIDLSNPLANINAARQSFVQNIVQPFLNIVSRIIPALLGPLPIGLLTDETTTLLYEGGFDDPVTIVEGDGVEHDATDGTPGSSPLGCAKVTCDGTYKIRRTEPQPVAKDWVLKAGADVKYESVVAAAESNAVRVEIVPYMGEGNPQAAVWMASDESPAGTEPWGPLNAGGSYTVPAGVTHVSVQWVVDTEATGGVVKFDNVYLQATQKIPQAFTKDLPEDLTSLLNFVRTWVESALSALGITPSGNLLDDIFDLSDEIEWIRDRAQDGVQDAAEALANLATLANNLLHNPGAVLGQIGQDLVEHLEDDLADAGDAIADVFDDIRDTWNRIVGGYRRTAVTGQTSQDVEEIMVSVGQEILVAQESTITLANQANAPKNVSYWETPNPFEDVSFPRALLVPELSYNVSGTTARANLGTLPANWTASVADDVEVHTHNITSLTLTPVTSRPRYTIAAGTLALSAVRVKQDRLINIARFIAGGDTPPPTALYVGLYAIDPETGNMALVHNFGDMKGDITTGAGLYETPCELPADVLVDAGALFAVGILPVGGSFTVAAIRRQPITTSALIYPQAATELLTGQSTLPETITESALNHTATHRIWVSVGQAVESTPEDASPVTLSMNFDVSNTNSWSSPSFQQIGTSGSRFGIDSGAIYCASDLLAIGEEVHWRSALCLTPVHTNDHSATITLDTQFNANTYGYTTTRAYVRCNNTGTSGVAMHLDSNSAGNLRIRIANITNMTSLGTVRATATTTFAPGDDLEIRAVGSLYKVYKNGVAVPGAEWDDTDEIVPIGKAWRRHGFGLGNRNVSAFTTYRTAYIDRYVAADLVA
ncbi:minor tail protein [Mycobacterium phage Velveteen]|uniref:minor tail protein n=1 Tax=Mycobacterium phage Velveteen TaxID=1340821 RepID=UPI0003880182|nr:minor tail protein [Mycobacterium phage Velveteen]YP_009125872.1 minor tail protein [Mycobacterium phage Cerasum]AVR76413.1 minor tail protein [Mycobacterium phage BigPhil]QZD98502.1 minor tail protein [Mycobacterium phage Sarma624]AGT12226.1 minor tail protein [Mycobacterium phage Velveteen]AIK67421.1 minor tail protein [Mycobacterium phage Cerasum]